MNSFDFFTRSGKKMKVEREYGGDKTIHRNNEVDVEVDSSGRVVAVWFRCQPLPFTWSTVTPSRAEEMGEMYSSDDIPEISAIVLKKDSD